jgi:hypothetical protein
MRGLGGIVRGCAGLGCLVLAAVTACASPVPGPPTGSPATAVPGAAASAAPGATPAAAAPGAPVVVASALASDIKTTARARVTSTPGKTTPPAAAPGSAAPGSAAALAAAGNPDGQAAVPAAGQAVVTSQPDHVIGDGTPASCTPAAVVAAVAAGGVSTFSCGPDPVTITMTSAATVSNTSHQVVLDGGGKVTLSGGGKTQILFMNAGWQQQWPQLVVQNLTFTDAYSGTPQASGSSVYGGGAIFAYGGQLKVVHSAFLGNSCYASGPDLGGGAIRAVGMYPASPVYITGDTLTGNSCSNGGALSGLFADFDVSNSVLTGNKAIGWGANPAAAGTPGGGSGGAIYTDGTGYNLSVTGTVLRDNTAREGGGGIFFVVNSGGGTLRIESSTLQDNPSGAFQNAPGIFDSVNGQEAQPVAVGSSIG